MKKKVIKVVGIVVSILLSIFFLFTFFQGDFIRSWVTADFQKYGLVFLFFLSMFLEISPQYIGPDLLMLDLIFVGFPAWPIIIVTVIGSIIGSVISFELGKKYGFRFVQALYSKESIKDMQRKIDKSGKWIVFLGAVTPIPYFPVIYGSLNFSRWQFIAYGVIPRALYMILIGWYFIGFV